MQQNTNQMLPAWTLDDAYGSVKDNRFQAELKNACDKMQELAKALTAQISKEDILHLIPIYEDAAESISSLISFSYCASSADITDADASSAYAQTQALMALSLIHI